ncbi:MAG TPA: metallophosphoesterase family protein [Acetobacteraceae bacterium]|nr:metallophosphoesterase family protein [Acetobacteraceae bacterium]
MRVPPQRNIRSNEHFICRRPQERPIRLAVIADIHANLLALEAVLADIRTRGVDATINLGDNVAGPLWPLETAELLAALKLPTVRGNHDRWLLDCDEASLSPADRFAHATLTPEQRRAQHALPPSIELAEGILAVHGTPSDDSAFLTEEVYQERLIPASRQQVREHLGPAMSRPVVLCGHSHRQCLTQMPGGPLIINPGSVGCPLFADIPRADCIEPRSPHARYAILTRRGHRWSAEFLVLDYDWDQAAVRARDNGFANWAEALVTGAVT